MKIEKLNGNGHVLCDVRYDTMYHIYRPGKPLAIVGRKRYPQRKAHPWRITFTNAGGVRVWLDAATRRDAIAGMVGWS